jgi:antitoxin component YwqK of YwqJK toxin-antitoxin module
LGKEDSSIPAPVFGGEDASDSGSDPAPSVKKLGWNKPHGMAPISAAPPPAPGNDDAAADDSISFAPLPIEMPEEGSIPDAPTESEIPVGPQSIGHCPRCADHPKLAPPGEALHESICPDCNGRFLPQAATRHVVVELMGVEEGTLREMIGHFGAAQIDCPDCNRPMPPIQVRGQRVELCQGCGGMWLGPGLLPKLSGGRYADVKAEAVEDENEGMVELGGHIFTPTQRWVALLPLTIAMAGLVGPFAYVAGGLMRRSLGSLVHPFTGNTATQLFGSAIHAAFWPAIFILVGTYIAPKRKEAVATLLFLAATVFTMFNGLRAVTVFGSAGMVPLFGVANGLVGGFFAWRSLTKRAREERKSGKGRGQPHSSGVRRQKFGEDWPYFFRPQTMMSMIFTGSILGMSAFFVQTIYAESRGADCPNKGKLSKEVTDDGYHGRFCLNKAGIKSGPFTLHEPDGEKVAEGRYLDGKQVGEWIAYHPGQTVSEKGSFYGGRKVGEWTRFSAQGKRTEVAKYLDDRLHGDFRRFDENEKAKEEGTYDMGRKVGFWRTLYPNGRTESEGVYHNGKREGPFTFTTPSGKQVVRTYREGKEVFD